MNTKALNKSLKSYLHKRKQDACVKY